MSDFSEGHDLGQLQGKREEKQRIIKRLDSGEFTTEVFEWFTQHIPHTEPLSESAVEDLSERLIALINGECQKDNETVSLLPDTHCSDCDDNGCLHCTCAGLDPDCDRHYKGEGENK